MFPMVIFWSVALWAEIIYYAIAFYYRNIASTMNPKFPTTEEEMLFMPLATSLYRILFLLFITIWNVTELYNNNLFNFSVIIWHFASVAYSLYHKIEEENSRPTVLPLAAARAARPTAAEAAGATPQPQLQPQSTPTAPPTPPPSYDRIYKV